MKLMIDMPDEMLDWLRHGFPDEDDFNNLLERVVNGTPIEQEPKQEDYSTEILSSEEIIGLMEALQEREPKTDTWSIKDVANALEKHGFGRLEQEPCEDEYIKVPKKALKYRTAGMVAYNAEWLKNHFDMERAFICGAQEPNTDGDAISRDMALEKWLIM